jgi:hypothetical protein
MNGDKWRRKEKNILHVCFTAVCLTFVSCLSLSFTIVAYDPFCLQESFEIKTPTATLIIYIQKIAPLVTSVYLRIVSVCP